MKLRISIIIPLSLVLLSISISMFVFLQSYHQASNKIHTDGLSRLKLDMSRLQNMLYNLVAEDSIDLESARLNLSVTAMDSNIKILLLTDENNQILTANRYRWKDLAASKVSEYKNDIANKISRLNHPEVFESDTTYLIGYYPVVLHLERAFDSHTTKRGILYVEYSLETLLKQAQNAALNQSIIFAVLFLLASLVIAFLLHILVSRRLGLLTKVAGQLSGGDLDARAGLTGSDELGQLGIAFDEMVLWLKNTIDDLTQSEKKVSELNETLEERIEQRTQELELKKKELLDSQTIAHHANKMSALGEMASGFAHEINSPLQAISLLTYGLKKKSSALNSNEIEVISDKIDRNVFTISHIVESLRKMSHSSSIDSMQDTKIKEIIDDVTGITRERYIIRGIRLQIYYHADSEGESIYCQSTQIGQILINLLNNAYDAVKTSDEKWIKLDIYSTADNIRFIVSNSGVGIDKDIRDKIFEPMFTTKGIGEGTGLGLSISMEITRLHHGTLSLDEDSKTTRFILELPKKIKV